MVTEDRRVGGGRLMRLSRLWIDGWHNLRDVTIDFDARKLTTVVIGQNGVGKSNLLEAIAYIFRNADLGDNPPPFSFDLEYRINTSNVRIAGKLNEWSFMVDEISIPRSEFERRKNELFPDLVFGYYSGGNNRPESIFNTH
jgi:AAA15 family ATPase/GTPase